MKCMDRKFVGVVPWDQSNYTCEFEQFESIPTKTNFNFIHILPKSEIYELLENDLVVFQTEFPNCLVNGDLSKIDVFKYDHKVKKIITNCPFSVEYFNEYFHYDKFIFGFAPFNPKYIPVNKEKIYDVFYTGHLHNSIIYDAVPIMKKFNPCFVCADYGNEMVEYMTEYNKYQTYINLLDSSKDNSKEYNKLIAESIAKSKHKGIGYQEKLNLNAQSKISVVHGLLYWPEQFKANIA